MVHHDGKNHQRREALLRLETKGRDLATPDDEVLVLILSLLSLACEPPTKDPLLDTIEEPEAPFVRFIPIFRMLTGIMDIEKAEITTPSRFLTVQSTDSDRYTAIKTLRKPTPVSTFTVASYWSNFSICMADTSESHPLDCVTAFITSAHTSYYQATRETVSSTAFLRKGCAGLSRPMTVTPRLVITAYVHRFKHVEGRKGSLKCFLRCALQITWNTFPWTST